jgi:hypothetical protein
MLHLDTERLAELADSEPTAVEAAHLSVCDACSRERDAHRRLVALAAGDRDRLAPPITNWASIAGELRAEGLLHSNGPMLAEVESDSHMASVRPIRRGGHVQWWMRVAAGVTLLAGGAMGGRWSAMREMASEAAPPVMPVEHIAEVVDQTPAPDVAPVEATPVAGPGRTELEFKPIVNREQALQLLQRAQFDYQRAAAYLAANDTTIEAPSVYKARIAAFDQSAAMFEEALASQPSDPVINAYYRATLQSRDVTLRQLGNAVQLVRY